MNTTVVDKQFLRSAWEHADRAARESRVEIREIRGADIGAAGALIGEAWGAQQIPQSNLLQALAHAGNPVLLAAGDAGAVGVCFGFLGWRGGLHLHSHMTAVTQPRQSRGVGYALKVYQRAICLDNDITEMRWTYDPLIARNAHFNLVKLGATVKGFFPDFYGDMDDVVNAGDHSDRFEVSWRLDADRVVAALEGREAEVDATGDLVAIPSDFASLRRLEPARARQIRLSTRDEFARLFSAGLSPRWTDRGYLFSAGSDAARQRRDTSSRHG